MEIEDFDFLLTYIHVLNRIYFDEHNKVYYLLLSNERNNPRNTLVLLL